VPVPPMRRHKHQAIQFGYSSPWAEAGMPGLPDMVGSMSALPSDLVVDPGDEICTLCQRPARAHILGKNPCGTYSHYDGVGFTDEELAELFEPGQPLEAYGVIDDE
jgi:hypothetical protein